MRPFLFTQPCRIWPTWVFNYIVRIIGSDLNDYSCKGIRLNYHETVASASVIFAALAAPLVARPLRSAVYLFDHPLLKNKSRKPKHLGCIWRMIKFLETEKDSPKASKYPISLLSSSKSHTDFTLGCMKKEGLKIYPCTYGYCFGPFAVHFWGHTCDLTPTTQEVAFMIFQSSLSLEKSLLTFLSARISKINKNKEFIPLLEKLRRRRMFLRWF